MHVRRSQFGSPTDRLARARVAHVVKRFFLALSVACPGRINFMSRLMQEL